MNNTNFNLLQSMYLTMLRIRTFEERVADLINDGEIETPCHLYIGQEAIATGVCSALEKHDYIWGGHRSHGHYLAKGGDIKMLMAEIYGKITGCAKGRGGSMHVIAPEVGLLGTVPLVAGTIPLAVGAGMAAKLSGNKKVSVSFFGDGAMEEGHLHESINLAALYHLPVIFICENNYYSSHMHISQRRLENNLYKVSDYHGIPGHQIDGNDIIAVYQATLTAAKRARTGAGPTFLEFQTYRWRGHVGSSWDMDVGVKRKDELQNWLPKDPIKRVRQHLVDKGVPETELSEREKKIQAEVEEAVLFAQESPYPEETEVLKHVFHANDESLI